MEEVEKRETYSRAREWTMVALELWDLVALGFDCFVRK
jgi:hypothetical protein